MDRQIEDRMSSAQDVNDHEKGTMMERELPSRFERLWSIEETASYLAMAPSTLYGWRGRKYGPPSYRLGNKIRYRPEEVRAWVDARNMLAS